MKTLIHKLLIPVLALCALVVGANRAVSQVTVTVDPGQNWIGYMNVFSLANAYEYGFVDATANLQGYFSGTNLLVLAPCTNVWETVDTVWVQADGMTPNQVMDANFYVQNDALANTNLIFSGTCLTNTLTNNPEPLTGIRYTSVAFIKTFDGNYTQTGITNVPLAPNTPFSISWNTTGAVHVQYGFETIGPDANPATVDNLGIVTISAAFTTPPPASPTNNAPVPTVLPSRVLAMYNSSGTYPNHTPNDWLAGWSSASQVNYSVAGSTNVILKYSNLQYAGIEFYDPNQVDTTGYDTFHVDLWTPDANQFGIQLVSLNPTIAPQVNYFPGGPIVTNQWVSLDIPLNTFSKLQPSVVLSDLQQMLWIDNQSGGGVTGGVFYIDNVYFYATGLATLTPAISGGQFQLSFFAENTFNYTVQYKTHLSDPTWTTLTTVPGDGTTHMVPDTMGQTSRYYRVYGQ